MSAPERSASIFSQNLDRVAFTAYFLGAVAPLVALAIVAERYILPTLTDGYNTAAIVGVIVSLAILSLGSFLVLRRSTQRSLSRMNRDNRRLEALLSASRSLGNAGHEGEAAAATVRCALELTDARAAFVFGHAKPGGPDLVESNGKDLAKLPDAATGKASELAALAMESGHAVVRGPSRERGAEVAAASVPLAGEREPMGALVVLGENDEPFDTQQVQALSTLAALAAVSLRNSDLRDAQRNFFSHMTDMLVTALDAHLGYNSGHGHRVARLANRLGRELGLDDPGLQRLHFAALLHDIGMLKLDRGHAHDARSCEKHTLLGFRMLGRIRLWEDVAPIVLHHHEWFDGSGYPEGLAGADIPLEARIIAVCDAYDTMTSETSYKVAMEAEAAVAELERSADCQFDPAVVVAFRRLFGAGEIDAAA